MPAPLLPIDDEAARAEAARLLLGDAIVAYPTDTLYALGARATSDAAVAAVLRLKERLPERTLPLIAADLAQVEWLGGKLSPQARRLAERWWPGPLTLVIDARQKLAAGVVAPDGSVAVRVPAHEHVRDLMRRVGMPVTSTSANRAGTPAATTADACVALGDALALVLDDGPAKIRLPSTIADVRGPAIRLVREGILPWDHVLHSMR